MGQSHVFLADKIREVEQVVQVLKLVPKHFAQFEEELHYKHLVKSVGSGT